MAAEKRRTDPALEDELYGEPYRFGFFQAVRLLERIHPDLKPVGRSDRPDREVVRFQTPASLDFPPSEIHALTRGGAKGEEKRPLPAHMIVAFMGMSGPSGVLPHVWTEFLMDRLRAKDRTLLDFLDLFNHRALSLFYRAWEKYRFSISWERRSEDRFTEYLFDLIGMGTRGLRGRMKVHDQGLIGYGGLIAQRPHSATALAAILGDQFGVGVRVEQFFGQWLRLEARDLTRLGRARSRLGESTIAGARVWDNQSRFRVRIGPLRYRRFITFLPVGTACQPLSELTRFLAGQEFDFDYQLVIRARDVPACILTTRARRKPMLGWTTWLKTEPFTSNDDQVILRSRI